MTERATGDCPNCGMSIEDGSNPTERGGKMYCCEGCASGGQCTCPQHGHQA